MRWITDRLTAIVTQDVAVAARVLHLAPVLTAGVSTITIVEVIVEEPNYALALELYVSAIDNPGEFAFDLARDDATSGSAAFIARACLQIGIGQRRRVPLDLDGLTAVGQIARHGDIWIGNRYRAARGRRFTDIRRKGDELQSITLVDDGVLVGVNSRHQSTSLPGAGPWIR